MAQQAVRLVLRDHADATNAGIQAVRQREIDDAELAAEVHRWLGAAIGQAFEAAAAAPGEHQRHGAFREVQAQGKFVGRHLVRLLGGLIVHGRKIAGPRQRPAAG